MALIKEPLDKAKQRNEKLEAAEATAQEAREAEEAAAQEALGREQEAARVSEWEERYKLSRSSSSSFGKDCLKLYRISCKPRRKHGKAVWTRSVPTMRKPKA